MPPSMQMFSPVMNPACSEQRNSAIDVSKRQGHAVSADLLHWQSAGIALYPGESGSYDDDGLWTGCVGKYEEMYYMYYTARSLKEQGQINRIALATSPDGWNWTRHAENPVLIPDGRWYASEHSPIQLYGHGPVSYTHLDVYKRQRLSTTAAWIAPDCLWWSRDSFAPIYFPMRDGKSPSTACSTGISVCFPRPA